MVSLGRAAKEPVEVFFTGGVTAILHGWRQTTIDVDVKLVGAEEAVLRAQPALKKRLGINIELAAPDEFIPELSGWRERCIFIGREGKARSSTTTSMRRRWKRSSGDTRKTSSTWSTCWWTV